MILGNGILKIESKIMSTEILSWNISSGGFKDYGSTETKPPRIDDLVKIINQIKPDVVSLVDTYRWTKVFTPDELKKIFGYPYVHSVKFEDERLIVKGHDNGITVFSQIPNTRMRTIRFTTRNAVSVKVGEMDIFSVYLDDISEDTRIKQVEAILKDSQPECPNNNYWGFKHY